LKVLHDPTNFKTYDQLKARLHKVLGFTGDYKPETHEDEVLETQEYKTPKEKAYRPEPSTTSDDGDDDVDEFFRKLAQDNE
jgi:hypothetical protein